jgi:hypothetical protein
MEKQHNRGQDGAGIATVKLDVEAGYPFLYRQRSSDPQPIASIFAHIGKEVSELEKYQPDIRQHPGLMKGHLPFLPSFHQKKYRTIPKPGTCRKFQSGQHGRVVCTYQYSSGRLSETK